MPNAFGKYVIERKLGQGGMGVVYLAVDPALNRQVALKIITSDDQEMLERFQREAQAAAKLKHPNIVQVYEAGAIDKQHYFTMDYIEGVSLEKLIKAARKPSLQNIAKIILQVAAGLQYAHSRGIIHRDIKPGNIMIDKQGKAYIADFGLAKQLTGMDRSLTMTGTTVGTPDYMSPEQAQGRKDDIDPRTDIFSLGSTLYHCITGRLPFTGNELLNVLNKVVNDDPPVPSSIIKVIPKDLETICLKCMAKDQDKRYQSAAELAGDIKKYIQGAPITARRTSTVTKLWLRAKKNRTISLSIASAAVILIAVIIGLLISSARTTGTLDQYRQEARAYHKEGKIDDARIACEKARAITKTDAEINAIYDKCLSALKLTHAQAQAQAARDKKRADAKAVLDRASAARTPEEKIRIAEDAIKIDLTFADAYQTIGYAYKEKAESARGGAGSDNAYRQLIDQAHEYFTKAIEANPRQAYSYYERGMIAADRWNKPEDAIPDFEKVLELDPDSHIGWYAKGNIEDNQQKYDGAIASYSKAIKLYPEYDWAYNNRGIAYVNKSEIELAIKDYDKAIELNPNLAEAYGNRGNAYKEKGETDRAIKDYTKTIELNPNYAMAYSSRGNAYQDKGEIELAIQDYNKAIELNPNYTKAYYNRGNAYTKKAERESRQGGINADAYRELSTQAIKDFNKAIELGPSLAEAYGNRGNAYVNKGEIELAIKDYNKAIELNPNLAAVYNSRGSAYYSRGKIELAIKDYAKAIELNPNLAEAYGNRGNAYANKGEIDRALKDHNKAIELNPKDVEVYTNRGNVYVNKGEIDRALRDYNKAIELNPKSALTYLNRGNAYALKKDYQQAIADGQMFLKLEPEHSYAPTIRGLIENWKKLIK